MEELSPAKLEACKQVDTVFAQDELVVVPMVLSPATTKVTLAVASPYTPEMVASIIRHTSGILRTPLSLGDAKRLASTRWLLPTMYAIELPRSRWRLTAQPHRPDFGPYSLTSSNSSMVN